MRILTNSLAANDVGAVHGGYSQYRKDLLEGGVKLWELKPLTGTKAKASMFGSSGSSLHTKALVVDGERLFVGSYNLDPRSTSLNCEQGVLVRSAALGGQFEQIFDTQSDGARAWSVTLVDGDLVDRRHHDVRSRSAGLGRPAVPGLARARAAVRVAA